MMVQLADGFQLLLELVVVIQPAAHLGDLFAAEAELARASAGIADGEDRQRMAFAAGTLGATAGVADGTLQEGAAEELGGEGEAVEEFLAGMEGALMCHL